MLLNKLALGVLILLIILITLSIQKQFQSQQEKIHFQQVETKYIQADKDIEKVQQYLKQLKQLNKTIASSNINKNNQKLIMIHLELSKLYQKLKLFEDSQNHVNIAYKLNPKNIQVLWQRTKKLLKNHNQKNENLDQIDTNLKYFQENIDRLSVQAKSQYSQIKQTIFHKNMIFKKGYQFAPSWIQAINNNHLRLQYFLDKSQYKQIDGYFGVFAKQEIPAQKIIIVQRPFFYLSELEGLNNDNQNNKQLVISKYKKLSSISRNFKQKFSSLPNQVNLEKTQSQRKKYINSDLDLSEEKIFEKYQKNAFLIYQLFNIIKGNPPHYRIGLYQFPSLINYSCDPNLQYFFIGDFILIRTLKEIEKGEELTYAYLNSYRKKFANQENELLWQHRNQECTCALCPNSQKQDDKKVKRFLNGQTGLAKQFIKQSKLYLIPIFEKLNQKALKMQILAGALDYGTPNGLADALGQIVDWKIKRQQL